MARSIFFYTDSHIVGGAERALLMLAGLLDRAEWEPVLLVDGARGMDALSELASARGIPVRPVEPMPLGAAGAARVPAFARMLRRERPVVFHAHLSAPLAAKYALAGAILARVCAVVATVHLMPQFELDRSSAWQLRALATGVGRYIAVSHDIAAQLIERLSYPARKVQVVHNAVDPRRFRVAPPPGLRDDLTGGTHRAVVLTCARLDPQKGLDVLVSAAAELPEAVFVIAGDGPERTALEAQARSLRVEDRISFLGGRDDVPALLAVCDAVALPSLYEGTSLAVLEAMAAGRPVVSSAIRGTDELIADGESGLLVPPSDHVALAAALRRVLGDDGLRTALAARARERVRHEFTPEMMGRRVVSIYEELLTLHR